MLLPSHANAVLKRQDIVIADAKSVIRLPQLTGALRSAPLGESFLFQDSLEEAIKVQKTLDPIPTKHASWPRPRNRPPPLRYCLPTQVGTTREAPLGQSLKEIGNAPRNHGSGGRSAQRGHKEVICDLYVQGDL
jgi:hypothetical protein